jgi:succinoglycan biosynthesis protein ExoA
VDGSHLPQDLPGAEDEVDCSVLVPVLNEERHIVATVGAMRKQRFPGRLEFLVADGGSGDRTRAILEDLAREDPRIRVLENPRRIAASGLNVALRHARGRWIARMDAHTSYPDNYVALGVRRLARGDAKWVSGPPIATGDGPVSRAVALALRTPLGRGGSRKWASSRGKADDEYPLDAGVFAGVWKRETLLDFGGWDEEWVCNQDSEMAARFLARQERLICVPAMAAEYVPRNSIGALWRQYLRYGEFREKTAVRHPHSMRRSHLLAPGIVVASLTAIAGPRPLRRVARAGVSLYAIALAAAAARVTGEAEEPADAALVPVVLATMHFAHGMGAFRGARRYGPPLSAISGALGMARMAQRLAPRPADVYAPSLLEEVARGPAEGGMAAVRRPVTPHIA